MAPAKSSGVELVGADLADEVLVGRPEAAEVERVGVLDARARAACGSRRPSRRRRRGRGRRARGGRRGACRRRPRRSVEFMTGTVVGDGPHDGVADEVGEADLAAAGAAQVAVDDRAVDLEQLGRHLAEAGGRRDSRLASMLATMRAAAPRSGSPVRRVGSVAGGRRRARLGRRRWRPGAARRRRRRSPAAPSACAAGAGGRRRRRRDWPVSPARPVAGADVGTGRRLGRRAGSRRRTPASSRSPRTGRPGTARTSRRRAMRSARVRRFVSSATS